jgi:hypothetical protein
MAITLATTSVQLSDGSTLPNFTSMTQFGAVGSYVYAANFMAAVGNAQTTSGSNIGYKAAADTGAVFPPSSIDGGNAYGGLGNPSTVGNRLLWGGGSLNGSLSAFRGQIVSTAQFPTLSGSWRAHQAVSAPQYNIFYTTTEQGNAYTNYAYYGLFSRVS